MNGGMNQEDFRPVGLYIENGREVTRANTATLTRVRGQRFYQSRTGFLRRWWQGRHPGDEPFSRRNAESEFRHPVWAHAHRQQEDPPEFQAEESIHPIGILRRGETLQATMPPLELSVLGVKARNCTTLITYEVGDFSFIRYSMRECSAPRIAVAMSNRAKLWDKIDPSRYWRCNFHALVCVLSRARRVDRVLFDGDFRNCDYWRMLSLDK
jgi:hypothetical protein